MKQNNYSCFFSPVLCVSSISGYFHRINATQKISKLSFQKVLNASLKPGFSTEIEKSEEIGTRLWCY